MSNASTTAAIPTISRDELIEKINNGERFEFWNVLTDEYFDGALITGSRRVALDQIGREVSTTQLSKEVEIVVYCAGPDCPQSAAAAEKLLTFGYKNARAYEGGLEDWKSTGRAIDGVCKAACCH